MRVNYNVEYFTDKNGHSQVKGYINNLPSVKDKRIVYSAIDYLRNLGPEIQQTKMYGPIDEELKELRKPGHRILYAPINQGYVLLFAFSKDSRKTPPEHIATAHTFLILYKKQKGIK